MIRFAAALAIFLAPDAHLPAAPSPPLPPLPSLFSVPLVRIEATAEHVVVMEDVAIPRGDWRGGDLDLYVAFGAPGAPLAFDARLLAVPDGALEAAEKDAGEPVPLDRAPHRPKTAHLLLGRPQMSGAVLHVHDNALRRALTPGGMAVVRVRTLLPLPSEDANGGREIVTRLGIEDGAPLTLGRLELVANDPRLRVTHAAAHLCGPEADPYPLAIALTPRPPPSPPPAQGPLAPVLSARHPNDDLCVRFN